MTTKTQPAETLANNPDLHDAPASFRAEALKRRNAIRGLHNYATGEYLRPATAAECEASDAAGAEGAFDVDGVTCWVAL